MNMNFQDWRNAHSFIEDYFFYPEGEDFRWGRIRANWKEKREDEFLSHICAFTIDFQTGNLYSDCSKRTIWIKNVLLTMARPFFGLIKTAYHLCLPFSIPVEIFKAIMEGKQRNESASEIATAAWRNVKRSLADIIRTPLYTIAMTIVHLAAVCIGLLAPHKLYDLRELAGRLENALNRGEDNWWTLAPCFQPINNLMNIHKAKYQKQDTEYEEEPVLHGLNNLSRAYIRNQRDDLCHACFDLEPYISSAYVEKESSGI